MGKKGELTTNKIQCMQNVNLIATWLCC